MTCNRKSIGFWGDDRAFPDRRNAVRPLGISGHRLREQPSDRHAVLLSSTNQQLHIKAASNPICDVVK